MNIGFLNISRQMSRGDAMEGDSTQLDMFAVDTLKNARRELHAQLDEGVICPCCGRLAKAYRRKLNSGMAKSLIWLVGEYRRTHDWVDIQKVAPRYVLASREIGKLLHWEFVELKPNDDDETGKRKTSGMWRPTELGIKFVFRELRVPSHVRLYDNVIIRFEGDKIDIVQALGSHFNYRLLMAGI